MKGITVANHRVPMLASFALALALVAGAGALSPARAQPLCNLTIPPLAGRFPHIPVCAFPGAWQDSTLLFRFRCQGLFQGPLPDSVRSQARTITVRFVRDRLAERRPDFGGYRIYRVINTPDTSRMVLIRRFSLNAGDELTWHFSTVDTNSANPPDFRCGGQVVNDSIVTFIDPDSNGTFQKVCRRVDHLGRCLSPGDSIFQIVAPPGPHDGFLTWYAVTYESKNITDNNYEDMFVPDSLDDYARCGTHGNPLTCPNLNSKSLNMSNAVEPTGGPEPNLERVSVVPNPYRGTEVWDAAGGHEIHFINLPSRAHIRIYSVDGGLVRELEHVDDIRDFERWDLKNAHGRDVASGIYVYRVESANFSFQNRFIVIR